MLPPDSPRIGGDSRLDELFALLATEEAAAGPEVTGLQWCEALLALERAAAAYVTWLVADAAGLTIRWKQA